MENKTIKQIADELGTSKTTVAKIIKKLGIEPQKQQLNNQYVIVLNSVEIGRIKSDFAERHPQTTANNKPQTTANVGGNQPQTAENTTANVGGNLQTTEKALELLEKQLDIKDKTIKELQEQLAAAYKQISEQSLTIADLANKASYITAADKTVQIMDKQQAANTEPQEEPQKKSLWDRIRGK